MRYAKLCCIEFYSCCLQQYFQIDLFFYRTPNFLGSLVFSGTHHGVKCPCGVVHDRARFNENNVLPQKWGK